VQHRTELAVNTVEFLSDTMSYIVLIGRWSIIVVLNVHASTVE
jgi:hypothetical protein